METIIYATSIRIKKDRIFLILQSDQVIHLKKITLTCQNTVSPVSVPLTFQPSPKNPTAIQAQLDTSFIRIQSDDWSLTAYSDTEAFPIILSSQMRAKLILLSYKLSLSQDMLLFPFGGPGHKLLFRCRKRVKYDNFPTQLKEMTAFVLARFLKPILKKKNIWLVYEKYCSSAQDNGFYFFKYCMEQLPPQERHRIYFILDKDSPQWTNIQKYQKQVLPFMSFRHILYLLSSELYVASDARPHAFIWKPMPNLISREINKHDIFFLQHGVLGLKRVEDIFGKNGACPMTYFAVSSEKEQQIVVRDFGYDQIHAPIVGLARWDVLKNKSTSDKKRILIMPTWRSWLENKDHQFFCDSQYYQTYMHLLQNKELEAFLKETDTKMIFYIHPKLQDLMKTFHSESSQVELIGFGEQALNQLIMECSMFITDYSSVCWDVHYLEKPVLFYQFDMELYEKTNGSYLDMEHELFGDRCTTEEQLIHLIKDYVHHDFHEKECYKQMRKDGFSFRDQNNCQRTYNYIKSQGY